jgi:geranylgeranyl diphosphate synthase, type I
MAMMSSVAQGMTNSRWVSPDPLPLPELQQGLPRALGLELYTWLEMIRQQTERLVGQLLEPQDETSLDELWQEARRLVKDYSLRPSERMRTAMVLVGYAFGRGESKAPAGLWRFASATELLHAFMRVRSEGTGQEDMRSGRPSLQQVLGPGQLGEDLAVLAGDYLHGRAVEVMLKCGLPRASEATSHYLQACRHTLAGHFLDCSLPHQPLSRLNPAQALRVACLKTALYGFSAPLVCGAMLADAEPSRMGALEQLGRHMGLACQLQEDLHELFGAPARGARSVEWTAMRCRCTYPVMAAWQRAPQEVRRELEGLWGPQPLQPAAQERLRQLVDKSGGRVATERFIQRSVQSARGALETLPEAGGMRAMLEQLLERLTRSRP